MRKLATTRVVHIWVAMLAILFAALAPSVSHALAAGNPTIPAMQICSVGGMTDADSMAGLPADSSMDPAKHAFEHCPYCATHAGSFALLPGAAIQLALIEGHDLYPPLFYRAPQPLFSWSAGKPRGPPAIA
ncbi:DUF2946 domain-containing protein [Janthinobacterium aquaticum]|uniref:DUF2946 domain-containing protein n=1 Tax=Janthinobacterium sp. FT58W TaxID=2654254 RepID=UPI0012647EAD|nr:DUF2946 domain-containing protein [Janthinobacterium sp. FT58W]KAB8038222.1 DUF2946 domain-containing protein [Janthinobacterium sp. FT58W]